MSEALFYANALEVSDKNPALINVNNRAAAELRRLHQHELANQVWHEKTEWVQQTAQPSELGMHRADVLRQRIDRLHAVNEELLGALKACRSMVGHPDNLLFIDAAIAKAGEQA